jgi:hypothetical protein
VVAKEIAALKDNKALQELQSKSDDLHASLAKQRRASIERAPV